MTVGSAGACNVILKSILDPGDEVIVLTPYFAEYQFYISNHGGCMVPVETDASFLPDAERIAAAITPRTRALILNTPNNPTGRVYPESVLRDLDEMLTALGQPITVLSDEPYKSFVYDGGRQPEVASLSPIRRSATHGRSRWDWRANASATWRCRRVWRIARTYAAPAPSATARWDSSTHRQSGRG